MAPTPDAGTQLAIERTWLAHERTTMAWVRTATSLISFGFTIYKFFQLELKGAVQANTFIGSRGFATIMIVIGLSALLLANIQQRQATHRLATMGAKMPRSVAEIVGWLVGILGVLALTAVILRQ
jgi:putative membrane protein